jgi:hypothetical protein
MLWCGPTLWFIIFAIHFWRWSLGRVASITLSCHSEGVFDLQIAIDEHHLFFRDACHAKSSRKKIATLDV